MYAEVISQHFLHPGMENFFEEVCDWEELFDPSLTMSQTVRMAQAGQAARMDGWLGQTDGGAAGMLGVE